MPTKTLRKNFTATFSAQQQSLIKTFSHDCVHQTYFENSALTKVEKVCEKFAPLHLTGVRA